ncbi:SAM-dependent methyltransferase [Saccharopolyspora dendranthemae]|uniref:S-adenosyl-L-methionine-dependent methyltransferase n=1 Tax=Saccharopolyspora dendranthemae TaxID=1181886 RepID=A0A561U7T7_9PSEU|nr:SAM-dependent methyltransferase [Saccharopolyspora dendranthemae]TWF95422.1 methyltransferase (TIGR00027 family) [Saccharopolyspora dendranthemae]
MRAENDEWDIATSVGVTALGVAAGRAVETSREDGLVHDPYAQAFVDEVPADTLPADFLGDEIWREQATYIGVRSRFFDEFFTDASTAGVRQAVVLAAGLDTRALRLAWPENAAVYEIDQPAVLEFKDDVLSRHQTTGASRGRRTVIGVDLRHDWPTALIQAGFDPNLPTAWLAEGLLPYLPAAAEEALFADIQKLSAPGSRVAVEHVAQSMDAVMDDPKFQSLSERIGIDPRELFYNDAPRQDPAERLRNEGWTTTANTASERAQSYGRPLPAGIEPLMGQVQLLTATRTN